MVKILQNILVWSLVFSGLQLYAQDKMAMPFDSTAHQFGETISQEDLKAHLSVLASDDFQGRGTGQKGLTLAANYIANHFKSLGFKPTNKKDNSYFQYIPLQEGGWDQPSITVDGKTFKFVDDFYAFPNSTQAMEVSTDEVIFAGYGIQAPGYNDFKKVNVKDKVIIIKNGEPIKKNGKYLLSGSEEPTEWTTNWRKKLQLAKAKGVKAVFVIMGEDYRKNAKRMQPYYDRKGMKLQDGSSTDFANTFYISPEMGSQLVPLEKMLKWEKKMKKKNKAKAIKAKKNIVFDVKKSQRLFKAENVLGYLEGTDLKDELLVITAHFDHLGSEGTKIFNGADDDGSGTVALLEVAEAFAKAKAAGKGPRRSVLFMTVSGEEKGLLGSEFYVSNPVFPLSQTIADLNIDMVGRTDDLHDEKDKNYCYIIGSDRLSTELHKINEVANKTYVQMDLDYKYNDEDDPNRFYYRSDHYNFAKNNIPIIFYFNGTHEDYHKETDTVDKIEFDMLQKRAQLVFYTAWQLVNQDKRIEVDVEASDE